MSVNEMKQQNENGAAISILRFPDCVRQRVGMYLSNKEHAIFEIIDNSIDEYLAGYATTITVNINNNEITVSDNGRGIPIEKHSDPEYEGLTQLEVAATVLHAGGKFNDEDSYKTITTGLNGVGLSCVNATSSEMTISVIKNHKKYQADFAKGLIIKNLYYVEDSEENNKTIITFKLDPEVWGEDLSLDLKKINKRLQQLCFLNPNLKIEFNYNIESTEEQGSYSYCYKEGLRDYLNKLSSSKTCIVKEVTASKTLNDTIIDLAFVYTDSFNSETLSFCNNINTEDGGDHLIGFRSGLLKAINSYAIENKYIKEDNAFEQNDVLEGICSIISIKVKEPKFISQAKNKINMREIRSIITNYVKDVVTEYFDQYPEEAKTIINKNINAFNARKAAAKARESVRKNKDVIEGSTVGKLADCSSKDPEQCEIFLVEGDSAAGSAKSARDSKYQAILPVFGKILNVEKARLNKVLESEKLLDLLRSLRCGIGEDFDINKLKYHKIILMSDADEHDVPLCRNV